LGRGGQHHRRQPLDRRRLDRAVTTSRTSDFTRMLDPWRAVAWLRRRQRRLAAPRVLARRGAAGTKKISLALQGGGAHGAFTWGVLDHLLGDGRLVIEGISGASAGAVNAVMLADGLARGGPDAARQRLADFWRAASIGGGLPGPQRAVVDRM